MPSGGPADPSDAAAGPFERRVQASARRMIFTPSFPSPAQPALQGGGDDCRGRRPQRPARRSTS
jgi:hypothetical protein